MYVTSLSGDFLDMRNACSLSFAFALLDLVPFPVEELETPSKLLACSNKANKSRFRRLTQHRTLAIVGLVSKAWSDSTLVWLRKELVVLIEQLSNNVFLVTTFVRIYAWNVPRGQIW